jgi:hypothetical protein
VDLEQRLHNINKIGAFVLGGLSILVFRGDNKFVDKGSSQGSQNIGNVLVS